MSPFFQFLARRLIAIPITLLIITLLLYGVTMLMPMEIRARLYWPSNVDEFLATQEDIDRLNERIIQEYDLDDPFPVQYLRWVFNLLQGDWGWSPGADDVLSALVRRTPATAELTFYSVLLLIPLGLISGVVAGWKENRLPDHGFRFLAFVATSVPPFILALVLLGIFYAGLNWFPPGRLDSATRWTMEEISFRTYTGFMTIDGLLNGYPEISGEAFRHLLLPVVTLSLAHWATLGRVTRVAIIEELNQQYVTAARGRGLSMREAVWRHAFRNALLPALNSSAISAASLITGVFVIEIVFAFPGISELIVGAMRQFDLSMTLGATVYSAMVVLPLMLVLDVLQAVVDPRVRGGEA